MAFTILISLAIGLIVGMLSGMLGIGGGTVLVPIFKLAYAMPAIGATATSLFTIIPTSISGSITHFRNRTCIPALGVAAGLGGAAMSPLGVWLASISPDWAIMVTAALVILYSAITMFKKAIGAKPAKAAAASEDAKTAADSRNAKEPKPEHAELQSLVKGVVAEQGMRRIIVLGALIGLGAGLLSGYVGVGGGFIMVPLFMQLLNTPMKLTSGTSLIAVMILAIPGTITQAIYGNIDWIAGIFVVCGSIPGAYFGSKLMTRIPERTLRFIFSGFLLVAATLLILNQLGVF